MRRRSAALLVLAAVMAAGAGAAAARVSDNHHPWRPHLSAAEHFIGDRGGTVAFAVETRHRHWGFRSDWRFRSASVVKAMLLVGYLRRVAGPRLTSYDRSLLDPMIRRSDNDAASRVWERVGDDGLREVARISGMHHFTPGGPYWGNAQIDARDQAHFFLRIDRFIPHQHRHWAMHLLATIVPEQRWGVGEVRPRGWRLYFKGGWGSGVGLVDHQVALLRRGGRRVAVAVLTRDDGSQAYGDGTLRGVFGRLLRSLARSRFVP